MVTAVQQWNYLLKVGGSFLFTVGLQAEAGQLSVENALTLELLL